MAVRQCALKLWSLQGLFEKLSGEWELKFEQSPNWPGLALARSGVVFRKKLELRLQDNFIADRKEFYELRYVHAWRSVFGGRECQSFCCGRIFADDLLCEQRVRRELAEKVILLGLSRNGKASGGAHSVTATNSE